jgi:septin 7
MLIRYSKNPPFKKTNINKNRTHMEELKEKTSDVLYENYRSDKLMSMGVEQDQTVFKEVKYIPPNPFFNISSPAVKQEEERQLHQAKLAKMESEMKLVFQQKVAEKEQKLKQSEEELYARHREMKDTLEKQKRELDERKTKLEMGRGMGNDTGKRKGFSLGGR